MGTRSLTVVKENGMELLNLYRQTDGGIQWHGVELASFLVRFPPALSWVEAPKLFANGGGCLAAQIVAHFKTGPETFYLYPTELRGLGEEYIYTIQASKDEPLQIEVERRGPVIFTGSAAELLVFEEPTE